VDVDGLFGGSGDQHVAFFEHHLVVFEAFGPWEAEDASGFIGEPELVELIRVDALGVIDRTVMFHHPNYFAPSFMNELTSIIANIPEALDNEGFVFDACRQPILLQ
jgi:hypothetical protein